MVKMIDPETNAIVGKWTIELLIHKLKTHFPARFPEWINSGILISWGAYLILHPEVFTQEATRQIFAGMAAMVWIDAPAFAVWGLVAMTVGFVRATALFVNGAYSRTPIVRLITSALSAFVWAQVLIGMMGIPNVGLIIYGWLVIMDLTSAYRASMDAAIADRLQKSLKLGVDSGRNSSRAVC